MGAGPSSDKSNVVKLKIFEKYYHSLIPENKNTNFEKQQFNLNAKLSLSLEVRDFTLF